MDRLDIYPRPSQSEIFQLLTEQLFQNIAEYRYLHNLSFENFSIFAEELFATLKMNADEYAYLKTAEFSEIRPVLLESIKTLVGWEIFMRLSLEERILITSNPDHIKELNWSELTDIYNQITCDSVLMRRMLRGLINRNYQLSQFVIEICKNFNSSINRITTQSPWKSKDFYESLREKTPTTKHGFVLVPALDLAGFFVTDCSVVNLEYWQQGFYKTGSQLSATALFIDEKSKFDYIAELYKLVIAMHDSQEFDMNLLETYSYGNFRSNAVLYRNTRSMVNWFTTMIDSYTFNFDAETTEDWNQKFRLLKNIFEILSPIMRESECELNLLTSVANQSDLEFFSANGIEISDLGRVFKSAGKTLYQHTSGALIENNNGKIIFYTHIAGNKYFLIGEIIAHCDLQSDIQSQYLNVLRVLSKMIITNDSFETVTSVIENPNILVPFVMSSLHKFVVTGTFLSEFKACESKFVSMILTGTKTEGLYLDFQQNKLQLFNRLLEIFLSNNQLEIRCDKFFSLYNRDGLHLAKFEPDFLSGKLSCLNLLSLVRRKRYLSFMELLQNTSQEDFLAICEVVLDQDSYDRTVKLEVEAHQEFCVDSIFRRLFEIENYADLDELKKDLRSIPLSMFIDYMNEEENLENFKQWIERYFDIYHDTVTNKPEVMEDSKPLLFVYVINMIQDAERAGLLNSRFANRYIDAFRDTHYRWASATPGRQYVGAIRDDMRVLVGSNDLLKKFDFEMSRFILLKNLLLFILKSDERKSNYQDLVKHIIDELNTNPSQLEVLLKNVKQNNLGLQFIKLFSNIDYQIDRTFIDSIIKSCIKNLLGFKQKTSRLILSKRFIRSTAFTLILDDYLESDTATGLFRDQLDTAVTSHIEYLIDVLSTNEIRSVRTDNSAADILSSLIR